VTARRDWQQLNAFGLLEMEERMQIQIQSHQMHRLDSMKQGEPFWRDVFGQSALFIRTANWPNSIGPICHVRLDNGELYSADGSTPVHRANVKIVAA
jgi:hypothetical protein